MTKSSKNATEYDTAKLRLRRPAMYNETTVIHFRSISNDSEHCSIPKYEIYVKYPIEFIQVEILLGYKDDNFNKTAIVERAKANTSMPQKYEHITSIPFNKNHKSYSHTFINPEPGYFYRILWER